MEIERKYLIERSKIPFDPKDYPCRRIEQGYLCTEPVVRIRRDNDDYYLTYKSKGLLVREEYNLPLTREAYTHLIEKADGYLDGMIFAEVEFPDEAAANSFRPPSWFGEDVTCSPQYQNSTLSRL